jgi:hypothetical protein
MRESAPLTTKPKTKIVATGVARRNNFCFGFIFKEVLRSRSQAVFLRSTMAIAIIMS